MALTAVNRGIGSCMDSLVDTTFACECSSIFFVANGRVHAQFLLLQLLRPNVQHRIVVCRLCVVVLLYGRCHTFGISTAYSDHCCVYYLH